MVRSRFCSRGKMRNFILVSIAFLAVAIAIWAFFIDKSSQNSVDMKNIVPLLTGSMKNFIPTRSVVPTLKLKVLDKRDQWVSLENYRGKILLVNFWATWCAPCIREMASLDKLQVKRGGNDFTVIAISQDLMEWKAVLPFLKKSQLKNILTFVDRKTQLARYLKVTGLPTTILFSKKGKELGRLKGTAEWDSSQAIKLIDYYRKISN
tara:strand:- start:193 stop:813 length:621 start_codon:yes stop_codon:yes gene_type:complete